MTEHKATGAANCRHDGEQKWTQPVSIINSYLRSIANRCNWKAARYAHNATNRRVFAAIHPSARKLILQRIMFLGRIVWVNNRRYNARLLQLWLLHWWCCASQCNRIECRNIITETNVPSSPYSFFALARSIARFCFSFFFLFSRSCKSLAAHFGHGVIISSCKAFLMRTRMSGWFTQNPLLLILFL